MLKRSIALIAALVVCGFAADEVLPKAETLIDKYIEATGGRAAYEKLTNQVSTGTMEFAAQGLKGTLTVYRAAPDKSYTVIDLPGIGKIEEGSNGEVAWTRSAMQGPRVKEGEEKATSLRGAIFAGDLKWKDHHKKAEVTGVEEVDGQPCYKLLMTPNEGAAITRYYSKQSNLLVKTTMTFKGPMGEVPVESIISDYRKEGDILMPHKVQQKAAGQTFMITVDSVKNNTEIPKDRFDLPEDIKALLKK